LSPRARTGNISITALNGTDQVTLGGTAALGQFGIASGTTGPTAATRVALGEDVAGSVFGLKLAGVSSTLAGATISGPAGSPAQVTVDLAANPEPGDTLTYSFKLPDGTSDQLTLTATAASPPPANAFTIGATPAATAANLATALTSGVATLAATDLTAASAVAAANSFFNTDAAHPPQRVNGPPFATATSLIAGTAANTVSWYTGEAGTALARTTATAPAIQTTTTNQTQAQVALQDMLQNIVGTNTSDVGSQILDLQTRLAASLQVTALLAHTNLVSLLGPLG
jgi:flagellar hook-associated protein 3 FlgL